MSSATLPTRSYARANQELASSFKRYLEARGLSQNTIRAYHAETVMRFVEFMGAGAIVEADRQAIRAFLSSFHSRQCGDNALMRHAYRLRAFFKFLALTGLVHLNPTRQLAYRKRPGRLPRVLTIAEVESLIAAARDPFERAAVEVLYSTGVRVSELINIKLENVDFAGKKLLIKKGKGGKDRYVLFGEPAAKAMRAYLDWRPSQVGFLFEAPPQNGTILESNGSWYVRFYVDGWQRNERLGSLKEFPTEADARRELDRLAPRIPGFHPRPARPYTDRAIGVLIKRLAKRANVGHVHPHSFRRAMACHMLSGGANIRVIQELLGHSYLTTTQIYTTLTAQELKAVHERCHPYEQRDGGSHVEGQ